MDLKQWKGFNPNLSEGLNFEIFLLGLKPKQVSHHSCFRRMRFLRALLESTKIQEHGFPSHPDTFMKVILEKVQSFFNPDQRKFVKVFSTVQRPLDFHGVDFFFYYNGSIVTCDQTLRDDKKSHRQTHLIFNLDTISSDEKMDGFAKRVHDLLKIGVNKLPPSVIREMNKRIWGGAYKDS